MGICAGKGGEGVNTHNRGYLLPTYVHCTMYNACTVQYIFVRSICHVNAVLYFIIT
jgi:hypothetical protein